MLYDANWKSLAQGEGYRSLKEAYIHDAMSNGKRGRSKSEYYRKFQWIIQRALNHSHHRGLPISQILLRWEAARGQQWWYGFYQDHNMRRFYKHKDSSAPMGIRGLKKYYKKNNWSPELIQKRVLEYTQRIQQAESTRKPSKGRWPTRKKKARAESRRWYEAHTKLHPSPESVR